jgi:steroid delta-isomerase-like uncharacterized protein
MSTATSDIPERFFKGQDRLKGPLPADVCAPGYRAAIAGFPEMDLSAHGEFGRAFYAGFPDIRHTVEETLVDGAKVAARFTLRGTHTATFMGIPPTGKTIEVQAMAVFTVDDGRVLRLEGLFDQLGMLRQLGVVQA